MLRPEIKRFDCVHCGIELNSTKVVHAKRHVMSDKHASNKERYDIRRRQDADRREYRANTARLESKIDRHGEILQAILGKLDDLG